MATLNCLWHNKHPWLLSQLQLNRITSGQLHLDSSWKTEYLSGTKSYATPIYLWTSDVESREKLNIVCSIKKKKKSKYINRESFAKKKIWEDTPCFKDRYL